jgi:hypothetical protein
MQRRNRVHLPTHLVVAACAAHLRFVYDDLPDHGSSCPASGGHGERGAGTRSLMSGLGASLPTPIYGRGSWSWTSALAREHSAPTR